MAETIKGLNIKLGLDTTEIDNNLKELSTSLKQQTADLKAINNGLKYDSTNVELWKKKQSTLNTTLEQTKLKLDSQNDKLVEAKKAVEVGALSEKEFSKMERSVMYTEAQINKLNTELENTDKKITALGNAKWDNLANLGSSLTKSLTVPLVSAISALTAFSVSSMITADEIADNASKVNLSTEAYQEWVHASQILAVDSDQLYKAFVKVNAILGDIASGNTASASESLAMIGLSVEDIAGLDTDTAFGKIRDALTDVGDEATRTAVANQIFGDKIGAELAQLLGATSSELENLKEETHDLGIVTDEQAKIAGEFTDSLDNLKLSFTSLGTTLATIIIPHITVLLNMVREKIIPSIKNLVSLWDSLKSSTKGFITILIGLSVAIGPILTVIGKVVPILKAVMTSFSLTAGTITILGKAISFVTLGWGALIAVIAVLLLKNEKFQLLLKEIFSLLASLVGVILELVSTLISSLMPAFESIMSLFVKLTNMAVNLIEQLLVPISTIVNVIIEIVLSLVPIIEVLFNALADLLVPISNLVDDLLEPLVKVIDVIISLITSVIKVVVNLISVVINPIITILNILCGIVGSIVSVLSVVINLLSQILMPILTVLIAILKPIIEVIELVVAVISVLMKSLEPLINVLLKPLFSLLETISYVLEFLAPILEVVANVITAILVPAITILYYVLKPVLDILSAIINSISWVVNNIGSIFDTIGDVFGNVGEFLSGTMSGITSKSSQSVTTNNSSNVNNNVTVNTTSSNFDVDSINLALGGTYL